MDRGVSCNGAEVIKSWQTKLDELHRTGQPSRYEKGYIRKNATRVPIELLIHLVTGSTLLVSGSLGLFAKLGV